MKITYRKIDELIPYERNAKLHPESQIDKLAYIIKQVGFRDPVLVDGDGVIVAGHGRCKAAKRAGLTEVPTIDASDMSPEQVKAYRIAANKVADTGYDEELLAVDLQEISELGVDLQLTGFDAQEILQIMPDIEIDVLDSEGDLSGGNYGDVRSDKIPVNIMGIGGLCDRDAMEQVKNKLVKMGMSKDKDNGKQLSELFLSWLQK